MLRFGAGPAEDITTPRAGIDPAIICFAGGFAEICFAGGLADISTVPTHFGVGTAETSSLDLKAGCVDEGFAGISSSRTDGDRDDADSVSSSSICVGASGFRITGLGAAGLGATGLGAIGRGATGAGAGRAVTERGLFAA
mmetsp:Transcript_872/g.2319  ORF Transcript_872/g.2319 Transcript_872/m.2319 type:complete len:140 (+) Transcript_872:1426-1845(+)